jgi:hypothetical protein
MNGHGMVFLGFGKYVRADRIFALEPITGGDRGSGSRTLVWVEGIAEPVVASRTQATILAEIEESADPSGARRSRTRRTSVAEIEDVAEPASRRRRSGRGAVRQHPQLFAEEK